MLLSASEYFILGRLMAAWRTASTSPVPPYWGGSLMDTVHYVFDEFGLEYMMPPSRPRDVDRGAPPPDMSWKPVRGRRRRPGNGIDCEGLIVGVPSLAIGVSGSAPEKMFVENTSGEIYGWVVRRPRMGLYLAIMRWLRPWVAVSPYVWLAMNDGSWRAIVEEWQTLPEFVDMHPHTSFGEDRPHGCEEAAEQAAIEAGCEDAYRLGCLAADVEIRLWIVYDRAQQADAFFRNSNDALGDPEEHLRTLKAVAEQILRSDEVEQVCRTDDGAIGFYESARQTLDVGEGMAGGPASIYSAITRAHGRALQASTYLYGTCRAPGMT